MGAFQLGALRRRALPGALLACALLLGASGCKSTSSSAKSDGSERESQPIEDLVAATKKPEAIGKFLVDVNSAIVAWNNLFLAASNEAEKSRARLVETHLTTITHQRRAELVSELESGPLNNRIVAAAALGFTHDVEAQSPLLSALSDPHPEVVSHALFGLWMLGRTDTPLEPVCAHLASTSSEDVRSNAALLAAYLTRNGARADCILKTARLSVLDASPTVRAHSTMILANCLDTESVTALGDRLYDEKPLVVSAAGRALTYLAGNEPRVKGQAARALVRAWIATHEEPQRTALFRSMVEMAQANYGSDERDWSQWADRLP